MTTTIERNVVIKHPTIQWIFERLSDEPLIENIRTTEFTDTQMVKFDFEANNKRFEFQVSINHPEITPELLDERIKRYISGTKYGDLLKDIVHYPEFDEIADRLIQEFGKDNVYCKEMDFGASFAFAWSLTRDIGRVRRTYRFDTLLGNKHDQWTYAELERKIAETWTREQ